VHRFRSAAAFASYTGTAPIEVSSGDVVRHRLSRAGDRQLNCCLHTMAITQLQRDCPGRTCSPAGVDELLKGSGLVTKSAESLYVRFAHELNRETSRDVAYFEDELPPRPGYRGEFVTRRVAVGRTDAQRSTVYILLREL